MDSGLTSYKSALDKLFARTGSTAKFGLERTRALLTALDNPHERFPAFHVAGTNGKGSVVATLDALLRSKGLRVGRYTSPHLIDFRERIVVNGAEITDGEVTEFLTRIEPLAEKLGATFFEITTALAFHHFAQERVDVAVIETGLGGRLDSTNVITPVAAAVTSVGLDHTEYLGKTLEEIAREKAGIYKPNVPAIYGYVSTNVEHVLRSTAVYVGACPIVSTATDYAVTNIHLTRDGTEFELERNDKHVLLKTGLVGEAQAANSATALATLNAARKEYHVSLEEAGRVLPTVQLRGRFERVGKFILDVAHNPDSMRTLVQTLESVALDEPAIAMLGVLRDKDWKSIMQMLCPRMACTILVTPPSAPISRAWNSLEAKAYADEHGWTTVRIDDFTDAIAFASERADTVVITGSFHTVGDALQIIE